MTSDGSENLVARWRGGDQKAAAELFQRYAGRLVALARSQLSSKLAHRIDPEDVVQSVYRSFFAEAQAGRYEPAQGGDLWRLLVTITLHKLQDQVRHNQRGKRAIERERSFGSEDSLCVLLGPQLAREPSPVEAVALADELGHLMRGLEPVPRRMVELRLQGYNLEEIAVATERCQRTVRRVFEEVKARLEKLAPTY